MRGLLSILYVIFLTCNLGILIPHGLGNSTIATSLDLKARNGRLSWSKSAEHKLRDPHSLPCVWDQGPRSCFVGWSIKAWKLYVLVRMLHYWWTPPRGLFPCKVASKHLASRFVVSSSSIWALLWICQLKKKAFAAVLLSDSVTLCFWSLLHFSFLSPFTLLVCNIPSSKDMQREH